MVRVETARVVKGFEVELTFTDGTKEILDLALFLEGPVFEPLRKDPSLFEALQVDDELGTIVWPNGADLCPDVLYMKATGKTVEDLFPALAKRLLSA
jgi:hypothetical protein